MVGGLFAYSVFFNYLETDLGWSRTLLSACMSVMMVVMGLLSIPAGKLSDLFGARGVLMVSGVSAGIALMLMSELSAPWQLFVFFSLLYGLGMSSHDVVTLSTVARWFPRKRGIASAVVKVGTATGQMIVPVLVSTLILATSWRDAFLVSGIVLLILMLFAGYLAGIPLPDRRNPKSSPQEAGLSFTQVRSNTTLWKMCVMQLVFFFSLFTIPLHIVNHGIDLGFRPDQASLVLSAIAGMSILGRLGTGFLVDHIGSRNAYLLCVIPLLASLLALQIIAVPEHLFYFSVVYGFAHGGIFTVVSPTLADYFGTRAHGTIFGMIWLFGTLGGAVGPIVTGWIFDTYGSYALAFGTLAIAALIGLVLVLTLPRKSRYSS